MVSLLKSPGFTAEFEEMTVIRGSASDPPFLLGSVTQQRVGRQLPFMYTERGLAASLAATSPEEGAWSICEYDYAKDMPGHYQVSKIIDVDFEKLKAESRAAEQARSAQRLWARMLLKVPGPAMSQQGKAKRGGQPRRAGHEAGGHSAGTSGRKRKLGEDLFESEASDSSSSDRFRFAGPDRGL